MDSDLLVSLFLFLSEIESLERSLSELPRVLGYAECEVELRDAERTLKVLLEKKKNSKETLRRLNERYDHYLSRKESLEKAVTGAVRSASDVYRRLEEVRKEISRVEDEILAMEEEIETLEAKVEEKERELVKLRNRLEERKEVLERRKREVELRLRDLRGKVEEVKNVLPHKVRTVVQNLEESGIFPIYAVEEDGFCGECGVKIPLAELEKLKRGYVVRCRSCGRFLWRREVEEGEG